MSRKLVDKGIYSKDSKNVAYKIRTKRLDENGE